MREGVAGVREGVAGVRVRVPGARVRVPGVRVWVPGLGEGVPWLPHISKSHSWRDDIFVSWSPSCSFITLSRILFPPALTALIQQETDRHHIYTKDWLQPATFIIYLHSVCGGGEVEEAEVCVYKYIDCSQLPRLVTRSGCLASRGCPRYEQF